MSNDESLGPHDVDCAWCRRVFAEVLALLEHVEEQHLGSVDLPAAA